MTRQEFEDLLDEVYPANKDLRDLGRIPLFRRLDAVCVELFMRPETVSRANCNAIREVARGVHATGRFSFEDDIVGYEEQD